MAVSFHPPPAWSDYLSFSLSLLRGVKRNSRMSVKVQEGKLHKNDLLIIGLKLWYKCQFVAILERHSVPQRMAINLRLVLTVIRWTPLVGQIINRLGFVLFYCSSFLPTNTNYAMSSAAAAAATSSYIHSQFGQFNGLEMSRVYWTEGGAEQNLQMNLGIIIATEMEDIKINHEKR